MAPRKKLTSKRQTTRHRAKVDKKVREHQRKLRKSDAKNVHKNRKDPGIPSMWPMKEKLLQKMKEDGALELAQKEQRKAMTLSGLAQEAISKTERFLSASQSVVEAKKKAALIDNSRRAFFREFREVVDRADVILQVLDARDPMGCRVKEVEEMVLNGGAGKRIVLVLNKIDLVPKETLEGWLKHLRRQLPTIAFKASTQGQKSNLGQRGQQHEGSSSDCLGAETLLQLLKNYSRSRDLKTAITVGVVGYPNVGKSSLINSLKRARVCKVGAQPGVTTSKQEIHLDKQIRLLDSPGIVFADVANGADDDDLFLRNCLRVESLADPVAPVNKIVARAQAQDLMTLYGLPAFRDASEFLLLLARRQGKLLKGGLPNIEAAARAVLHDWNAGKIPFYTAPPQAVANQTTIVSAWAPEFDLSAIELMETDQVINSHQHTPSAACMEDAILEDEEEETVPGLMHIAPVKGISKKDATSGYDIQMTADEAKLNPQSNKLRQKALKKAKKAAEKLAAEEDDAMDVDEPYNFSSHFAQ